MLNRGHVPMLAENTKVKILDNMYLFRPENAFQANIFCQAYLLAFEIEGVYVEGE